MNIWQELGRLLSPSDFYDDWYGHLTNQAGHLLIAMIAVLIMAQSFHWHFGEYPPRVWLFWAPLVFYVYLVEIVAQGWKGIDTVNDSLFFAYGLGIAAWGFEEIEIGEQRVFADLDYIERFVPVVALHLAIGCGVRIKRKIWPDGLRG